MMGCLLSLVRAAVALKNLSIANDGQRCHENQTVHESGILRLILKQGWFSTRGIIHHIAIVRLENA